MIMTADELRQYVTTDEADQALEARLLALELLIRAYTNNNFQVRAFRSAADAFSDGNTLLVSNSGLFKENDTLQITNSALNAGIVNVLASSAGTVTVKENLYDESGVTLTKVVYPADVKMGVANLMRWELERREKAGLASESLSRHSVTFADQTGENTVMGYPLALLGFLAPYMRARFGQGVQA